jgi:hypothetical protein
VNTMTNRCFYLGAALATSLVALTSPALAQDGEEESAAEKSDNASGWQLESELEVTGRAIVAESAVRAEDEEIDGDAFAIRLTPTFELSKGDFSLTFRNATTRLEFEAPDRIDRWQNSARLTAEMALGENSAISVFTERSDNALGTEFSMIDEWEFGGEIEHNFNRANRVKLGGSWRERSYDDTDQTSGSGPRFDGEYRYRFGANHYAYLRARYEEISSANARRELDRWSLSASYQRPIARDLRIRPEVRYQKVDFPGRALPTGGFREDEVLTPELTLSYSPGAWTFSVEGRYIIRNSTDPEFDRSGYRLALEISYVF